MCCCGVVVVVVVVAVVVVLLLIGLEEAMRDGNESITLFGDDARGEVARVLVSLSSWSPGTKHCREEMMDDILRRTSIC